MPNNPTPPVSAEEALAAFDRLEKLTEEYSFLEGAHPNETGADAPESEIWQRWANAYNEAGECETIVRAFLTRAVGEKEIATGWIVAPSDQHSFTQELNMVVGIDPDFAEGMLEGARHIPNRIKRRVKVVELPPEEPR